MWLRHQQLHDVGRVGAEHHQLAVRHVDDAHHAERDRQADRDEHQHRAEAQAEEQRLDARVERARAIDARARRPRPPAGPPRRARRSCRRRPSRGAARAGCAPPARPARRASLIAASRAGASAPSSAASARPVSISALTRGVGLDAGPLAQQRRRSARRATAASRLTAASRTAGIRARRDRSARRRSAAPAAAGCWCRSSSASSAGAEPASLSVSGSISSSDASALVGRLDDEDRLIGVADVEPIFEQRREHRARAAGGRLSTSRSTICSLSAKLASRSSPSAGEKRRRPAVCASAGDEHSTSGEQQP